MDGRLYIVLGTFLVPGALIGVTIWRYAANPLALLLLFSVMVAGGLYLLTYSETFRS